MTDRPTDGHKGKTIRLPGRGDIIFYLGNRTVFSTYKLVWNSQNMIQYRIIMKQNSILYL